MITRFPEPPPRVTQALHHLQIVRAGDADRITALGLDLERAASPLGAGDLRPPAAPPDLGMVRQRRGLDQQ